MKISEAWLREWINPPLSTQDLANQLTMAGLEVESLTPAAGTFDQVVVAKVVQTKPHPQADRLTLCEIDAGDDVPLAVVCGASNVRPGLMVALAKIGAHLPNGLIIKETKLRGELSQGMLCSAEELGLTEMDFMTTDQQKRHRLTQIKLLHRQILMYEYECRTRQDDLGTMYKPVFPFSFS